MKKNTKTYSLLVVVLAIWSTIGHQIFNGLNDNMPDIVEEKIDLAFRPKTRTVADTFSIQSLDRDPFLGTLRHRKKPSITEQTNRILSDSMTPISYHGLVKRHNSTNQMFVININGNQVLIKKGREINGVKLIRGNSKEIVVRHNNMKTTISKQ